MLSIANFLNLNAIFHTKNKKKVNAKFITSVSLTTMPGFKMMPQGNLLLVQAAPPLLMFLN